MVKVVPSWEGRPLLKRVNPKRGLTQKEAVAVRLFERGLSMDEMEAITGLSRSTIYSRLRSAYYYGGGPEYRTLRYGQSYARWRYSQERQDAR